MDSSWRLANTVMAEKEEELVVGAGLLSDPRGAKTRAPRVLPIHINRARVDEK